MSKQEYRKLISQRKREYTELQLRELSLDVVIKLMANEKVRKAKTLLLYYSMKGEVYTHNLVENLYNAGKTVLLPKVTGDGTMAIIPYAGPLSLAPSSDFHIMEPQGDAYADCSQIDLAIIPGIAFTPDGKRLGRGKGYYDRFLTAYPDLYKIGLCFPFQLLPDLPVSIHDVMMDEVVS